MTPTAAHDNHSASPLTEPDHGASTTLPDGSETYDSTTGPRSRGVWVAVPRAAAGIHVQSIDDKTFRSDTPACTCEERRVVCVWKERTVWGWGCCGGGGRFGWGCGGGGGLAVGGRGSARSRALPC